MDKRDFAVIAGIAVGLQGEFTAESCDVVRYVEVDPDATFVAADVLPKAREASRECKKFEPGV
jgi:hypothetical protein